MLQKWKGNDPKVRYPGIGCFVLNLFCLKLCCLLYIPLVWIDNPFRIWLSFAWSTIHVIKGMVLFYNVYTLIDNKHVQETRIIIIYFYNFSNLFFVKTSLKLLWNIIYGKRLCVKYISLYSFAKNRFVRL